ncbi:ovarian-specific serine/threonine-protein kinase Lok [Neodiprion fabricii]|uniref:ovarian-specific serine/threonine-protein kinase Lok n=1 Tax=Neodiprion fabricii TaxID=2872261 RepID=UPI001ED93202|nr:ovarian-specific serine/threonine-protein kinase Lok [Neodiprion fabricii]
MATEDQLPLTLPDTQNADILTPQSQEQEPRSQGSQKIWGMLYPSSDRLQRVEMTMNEYTLGRAAHCNICLTEQHLDSKKWWGVISKLHFRITRVIVSPGTNDMVVYLEDTSHNGTFVNKLLVGKGKRIILEHGDVIGLAQAEKKVYTFMSISGSENSILPPELKCKYAVSRTLGSGVCGEVKMIYTKVGCKKFALKTIAKNNFHGCDGGNPFNDPGKILNEVHILKALRHPCIIRMEEILDTPSSVYIVLELMEGGELFDRIRKERSGLSERIAKVIFYQVVLAVHYLHQRGITHRDLKPENILLATNAEITLVKVTDFGLSKLVDTQTMMRTFCGTPLYVAPEVLLTHGKGSYTNQVDVWSLGVILYCCLSGLVPFISNAKDISLQHQIVQGIYSFPRERFKKVSLRAIDLIQRMLTVDPSKRITIQDVVRHPWLLDREVRSIVSELMNEDDEYNENLVPFSVPSTSGVASAVVHASRLKATAGLRRQRIEPPTAALKRARVE